MCVSDSLIVSCKGDGASSTIAQAPLHESPLPSPTQNGPRSIMAMCEQLSCGWLHHWLARPLRHSALQRLRHVSFHAGTCCRLAHTDLEHASVHASCADVPHTVTQEFSVGSCVHEVVRGGGGWGEGGWPGCLHGPAAWAI